MISGTAWATHAGQSGSGLAAVLWGLGTLALCIPVVFNYRGAADWLAGIRWNRAQHKTTRQAVWYQRGSAAVFAALGVAVLVIGATEMIRG